MRPVHPEKIVEIPDLRDQVRIFQSRDHAGRVVAGMLGKFKGTDSLVLAIPSGSRWVWRLPKN
jgi:putative phosphoribosyl transferase